LHGFRVIDRLCQNRVHEIGHGGQLLICQRGEELGYGLLPVSSEASFGLATGLGRLGMDGAARTVHTAHPALVDQAVHEANRPGMGESQHMA